MRLTHQSHTSNIINSILDIYAIDSPIPITYVELGLLTIAVLPDGEHVILRHQVYSYNFASASQVRGLSYSNVTLWAVAGMGFYSNACTDITLTGVRVERLGDRPMSITADGAHIENSQGGFISFRDCLFEGQGDDGINVPTIFQVVAAFIPTPTAAVLQVGGRGAPIEAPSFGVGDTINFYNRSSMALLGSSTVASVGANNTIILSSEVPAGVGLYDLVLAKTNFADYVEITDCTFRSNRARGALVKSSNAFIARNLFDGCSLSGLKTETDGCYWLEGRPVTNWTAVNNTFRSLNYWGEGSPDSLGDIAIDNSVPLFKDGVPTTTCIPYSGNHSEIQTGITISGKIFESGFSKAAATIWSTNGLKVSGNSLTTAPGAPSAPFAIIGFGIVDSMCIGNVCDGEPCKTNGV